MGSTERFGAVSILVQIIRGRMILTWYIYRAVIRGFSNSNWPNYFLPVLYQTSNSLRIVAMRVDHYLSICNKGPKSGEQTQEKLEDAARVINRGFTICIADRASIEESRKWGTYYMSNLLFKMYFKASIGEKSCSCREFCWPYGRSSSILYL